MLKRITNQSKFAPVCQGKAKKSPHTAFIVEIRPYQFKPTDVSGFGGVEEDSSISETDIRKLARYTERLGIIDWCMFTHAQCYRRRKK